MKKEEQFYLFGLQKDKKDLIRYRIVLPLDVFILCGVIGVLLLIFSFSLGTEKGKKNAFTEFRLNERKIAKNTKLTESQPLKKEEKKDTEQLKKFPDSKEIEKEKRYKIQVASFFKEKTASREANELRKIGFPVSVAKKGKYVVIYVGGFDDEVEAKNNLQTLKQRYKDCILRRL